ncbi:MAG TPA: imidazole glycerol phosphate synthase subunit HisF [Gemmatimonadaceae bacterium]|nr:imidazole glycerol phosphate synthase subunit HisF [Gemmatimonadaceae bacterium]
MLSRRLVVCLDVAGGKVVKGVQFESLKTMGDPAELASRYELEGADEIVFLNIAASSEDAAKLIETVSRTADTLFIPLTVGGGINSVEDAGRMLRAGADKVSINSAAVIRPTVLTEAAMRYGSQCVVASIDARKEESGWRVYTGGGRNRTELDAVEWARKCAELGAGEILLTSIDRDGTRSGYDIELTRAVSESVHVPVIASGGGGGSADVVEVLTKGCADAALIAGALHDGSCTVTELKTSMQRNGIRVREAAWATVS